jgi:hypothetical protein
LAQSSQLFQGFSSIGNKVIVICLNSKEWDKS